MVAHGRRIYGPAVILTGLLGFALSGMSDGIHAIGDGWMIAAIIIWIAMNGTGTYGLARVQPDMTVDLWGYPQGLSGYGMTRLRGGQRGDQLVRVNIEVPKNLKAKERQKLEDYAITCGDAKNPISQKFLDKAKKYL